MILLPALAAFTVSFAAPSSLAPTRLDPVARSAQDVEYEKRKTEAGEDPTKLWSLYEWCRDSKREKEGKTILRRIVKIDPSHKDANVALGNIFHDGKWFPNQKKVDEYKKEQEVAERTARGHVQWKGQWVPAEDVPFLERGFVRDQNGNWADPEEAKKLAEGWVRQDLDWIPPTETENLEKKLWKCGDQWLPIEAADAYHAELLKWWRIPYERFHLYTTCERDVANLKIKPQLENAYDELVRIYGKQPETPVRVLVLRDEAQYSSFGNGEENVRQTTDYRGLSSVHHAYFADLHPEPDRTPTTVFGLGVGYWDVSSERGNKFGVHSVRSALGLSFAEALDPSAKAVERNRKTTMQPGAFWDAFYAEKRIPEWFRYGAAAYAERYYRDNSVGVGGDPLWTRKWSVGNIQVRGGLRQLKQILDFKLTAEGGADSEKLINEAGLVMAFILDGGNASVSEKFKKVQDAIATNQDKKAVADATKALEADLLKHEDDLKKFAGL